MTQSYATDSFISTWQNTKLNCNTDTQRVELVRKRNILAQQEVFSFLTRTSSDGWGKKDRLQCFSYLLSGCKQRSLIVIAVNVLLNVKSQNRIGLSTMQCHTYEWWQLSLLIWHIMETLCLFFIQGILWSLRTNKSWEWHAASAHEEGFSSWRTQGPCVCKQRNELLQEHKKQICCWSHAAVSGVQLAAEGRHSQQRYNSPALFLCAGLMFSLGGKKGKQLHFQ